MSNEGTNRTLSGFHSSSSFYVIHLPNKGQALWGPWWECWSTAPLKSCLHNVQCYSTHQKGRSIQRISTLPKDQVGCPCMLSVTASDNYSAPHWNEKAGKPSTVKRKYWLQQLCLNLTDRNKTPELQSQTLPVFWGPGVCPSSTWASEAPATCSQCRQGLLQSPGWSLQSRISLCQSRNTHSSTCTW